MNRAGCPNTRHDVSSAWAYPAAALRAAIAAASGSSSRRSRRATPASVPGATSSPCIASIAITRWNGSPSAYLATSRFTQNPVLNRPLPISLGGQAAAPAAQTATPAAPAQQQAPAPAPASPQLSNGVSVVLQFYQDLTNHDYGSAWNLGGRNLNGGVGYSAWVAGYATTASIAVTSYGTWGDGTVWTHLSAAQTDGTVKTYDGTYTVAGGVIVSAHMTQTS